MEYTVLTTAEQRQMCTEFIGLLEKRRYALRLDRSATTAITSNAEKVAEHLAELDVQILTIEEQHAAALAELAGIAPAPKEV